MSGFSKPGNHHLALAAIDLVNVVYEKAAKAGESVFSSELFGSPKGYI